MFGLANYSSILPYNSYIDVSNFTSIEELSDYLIKVMNDKHLYETYFEWKKHFCVSYVEFYCSLCQHLNQWSDQKNNTIKTKNWMDWWHKGSHCKKKLDRFKLGQT